MKGAREIYDEGKDDRSLTASAAARFRTFSLAVVTFKKSLGAAKRKRADVASARRSWVREQGWLDFSRLRNGSHDSVGPADTKSGCTLGGSKNEVTAMRSFQITALTVTAVNLLAAAVTFAADFGNVRGGFDPSFYSGVSPGAGNTGGASNGAGSTNLAANSGGPTRNLSAADVTGAIPAPANAGSSSPYSSASADRAAGDGNKNAGKAGSSSSGGDFIEAGTFDSTHACLSGWAKFTHAEE